MKAVRVASLGQITHALYEVGGRVSEGHVSVSAMSAQRRLTRVDPESPVSP